MRKPTAAKKYDFRTSQAPTLATGTTITPGSLELWSTMARLNPASLTALAGVDRTQKIRKRLPARIVR
jgi:hypothetical protein